MPYDYTDLEQSKQLVSDLTRYTDTLTLTLIEQNLSDSAGTKDGTTYYRPYYVAARQLQRNRQDQTLESAKGGVKFTGQAIPIKSLLEEQYALDLSLGLTVPVEYQADRALERTCGCSSANGLESIDPIMSVIVG